MNYAYAKNLRELFKKCCEFNGFYYSLRQNGAIWLKKKKNKYMQAFIEKN